MWNCIKCRERVEDDFDICWNCGTSKDGTEDPTFRKDDDMIGQPSADSPEVGDEAEESEQTAIATGLPVVGNDKKKNAISCLRCHRELDHVGVKAFHEGYNWGVFGDFGELFVGEQKFDVYVCSKCGRVEFFLENVGRQFR